MPTVETGPREAPTRYTVNLSDPEDVIAWVLSEGGLKWSATWAGELEGMRGGTRRRLFRRGGLALDELADMIGKTGRMTARQARNAIIKALTRYRPRARPPSADDADARRVRLVERLRTAEQQFPWRRESEFVDRQVLAVHLDKAARRGRVVGEFLVYKLGARAVAKVARIGLGTVGRAHQRLAQAGWLAQSYGRVKSKDASTAWVVAPLLIPLFSKSGSTGQRVTWALRVPRDATVQERPSPNATRSDAVADAGLRRRRVWVSPEPDNPEAGHPEYIGPTMIQRWVLARLSTSKPKAATVIARELRRTTRTIERHLRALANAGLASRSRKGWRRHQPSPAE